MKTLFIVTLIGIICSCSVVKPKKYKNRRQVRLILRTKHNYHQTNSGRTIHKLGESLFHQSTTECL